MTELLEKPEVPDAFRELEQQGWTIEYEQESAGNVHEPHSHEETRLFTVSGSMRIRLGEGEWVEQTTGELFVVPDGQLHEAVVGDDGWEYFAAVAPTDVEN